VCDECAKGRKRSPSVRTEAEAVDAAREVITRSPIEVCDVWRNRLRSQSELRIESVVMTYRSFRTK
jgi:hypothetical protein